MSSDGGGTRRWEKSLLGIWVNILSLDSLPLFGLRIPCAGVFLSLEVNCFPLSSSPHPSFYLLRLEWGFTEPPPHPPLPAPTTAAAAAAAVLLNVLRHGQQETRPRKTTSVIRRSGQAAGIRAAAGLARGTFPLVKKTPRMDAVCFFTST